MTNYSARLSAVSTAPVTRHIAVTRLWPDCYFSVDLAMRFCCNWPQKPDNGVNFGRRAHRALSRQMRVPRPKVQLSRPPHPIVCKTEGADRARNKGG